MTCDELAAVVDLVADGEVPGDGDIGAHLATCAACARSLEVARQVDRLLRDRPALAAPAQFTPRLVSHLRRARWRREQIVDAIFNSAMIATGLLAATGLWIALDLAGLSAVGHDTVSVLRTEMIAAAQKVAPSLPLYATAAGLIVFALGVWWWASDSPAL